MCQKKCRSQVLSLAYLPGHLGRDKTTDRILENTFGQESQGREAAVQIMHTMSDGKWKQNVTSTFEATTGNVPFTHNAMDVIGPLPVTNEGNKFLHW